MVLQDYLLVAEKLRTRLKKVDRYLPLQAKERCAAMKMSSMTYSHFVRGIGTPSLAVMVRIEKYLDDSKEEMRKALEEECGTGTPGIHTEGNYKWHIMQDIQKIQDDLNKID